MGEYDGCWSSVEFCWFCNGDNDCPEECECRFCGWENDNAWWQGEVCEFCTLACGIFKLFVMLILFSMLRLLDTLLGIVRLLGILSAFGIFMLVCRLGGRERVADVR